MLQNKPVQICYLQLGRRRGSVMSVTMAFQSLETCHELCQYCHSPQKNGAVFEQKVSQNGAVDRFESAVGGRILLCAFKWVRQGNLLRLRRLPHVSSTL